MLLIGPKHSDLSSAASRICHKLEKVCVDTSVGNRAFESDNQLSHSKTFFEQNKNSESSFRMSEFVKQSTNINSGADKADWIVDVNYLSSFTSKVELPFPSHTKRITIIGKHFLFRQNCFERKLKNRIEIVGTKLRTGQWSGINSTACRVVKKGRCLSKGLGAPCNEISTVRMWSTQEMKNHINVLKLLAIKLAMQTFWKTLKHKAIDLQVDNGAALAYLLKMGWGPRI